MTQAISLSQVLRRHGHRLCAVLVGKSRLRRIPDFFSERIAAPVLPFESPNFRTDSQRHGVSILGTALETLLRLPRFAKGLSTIHRAMRHYKPDVVVNFLDPIGGLYGALYRPTARIVCIGHQILALHPQFPFPQRRRIAVWGLRFYTRLCTLGSDMRLALSFKSMPDMPQRKIRVVPPLLREDIRSLEPRSEDFILVYILNDGYADDLARWHRHHRERKIIGFWDRKGSPQTTRLHENPASGISILTWTVFWPTSRNTGMELRPFEPGPTVPVRISALCWKAAP